MSEGVANVDADTTVTRRRVGAHRRARVEDLLESVRGFSRPNPGVRAGCVELCP